MIGWGRNKRQFATVVDAKKAVNTAIFARACRSAPDILNGGRGIKEKKRKREKGSRVKTLAEKMRDWKTKYKCSLGKDAGWCDGKNAARCPERLNCIGGDKACELAV